MDANRLAKSIAVRRWRELQLRFPENALAVDYCGCEPVTHEISAVIVSPSLVDEAAEIVVQAIDARLSVVGLGRSEGGPHMGFASVTVVLVQNASDSFRRRLESLKAFKVISQL